MRNTNKATWLKPSGVWSVRSTHFIIVTLWTYNQYLFINLLDVSSRHGKIFQKPIASRISVLHLWTVVECSAGNNRTHEIINVLLVMCCFKLSSLKCCFEAHFRSSKCFSCMLKSLCTPTVPVVGSRPRAITWGRHRWWGRGRPGGRQRPRSVMIFTSKTESQRESLGL